MEINEESYERLNEILENIDDCCLTDSDYMQWYEEAVPCISNCFEELEHDYQIEMTCAAFIEHIQNTNEKEYDESDNETASINDYDGDDDEYEENQDDYKKNNDPKNLARGYFMALFAALNNGISDQRNYLLDSNIDENDEEYEKLEAVEVMRAYESSLDELKDAFPEYVPD